MDNNKHLDEDRLNEVVDTINARFGMPTVQRDEPLPPDADEEKPVQRLSAEAINRMNAYNRCAGR